MLGRHLLLTTFQIIWPPTISDHYRKYCSLQALQGSLRPTNFPYLFRYISKHPHLNLFRKGWISVDGITSRDTKRQRAKRMEALCAPADGGNMARENRKERLGQRFLSALRRLEVNTCQVDNYLGGVCQWRTAPKARRIFWFTMLHYDQPWFIRFHQYIWGYPSLKSEIRKTPVFPGAFLRAVCHHGRFHALKTRRIGISLGFPWDLTTLW